MAYQTATATDVADLLDKLRLFLVSAGWTVDLWGDTAPTGSKQLAVHKDGLYATFVTSTSTGSTTDPGPYVGVYGHTGFTGSGAQAELSQTVLANAMSGPFVGYYFFEGQGRDGPYVHVVVETQAGIFKHFGTGVMDKEGVYTTGQYVFASRWSYSLGSGNPINTPDHNDHRLPFNSTTGSNAWGYIRADTDGISPLWMEGRLGSASGSTRYISAGFTRAAASSGSQAQTIHGPAAASPSLLTGRSHLWPLWCLGERGAGFYSPLGAPPDMRFVRIDNFNPKDIITLGTDEWQVFPAIRKNGLAGEVNSGTFGYAYRVNP